MAFTPPNYQDYLDSNPDAPLLEAVTRKNVTKHRCECGRVVRASRIVDIRHIARIDQNWACDGCWTEWQREEGRAEQRKSPAGRKRQGSKKGRRQFARRWLADLGAPQSTIDRHSAD